MSRDVIFYEDHFPFLEKPSDDVTDLFIDPINTCVYFDGLQTFDVAPYDNEDSMNSIVDNSTNHELASLLNEQLDALVLATTSEVIEPLIQSPEKLKNFMKIY